uniref:Uncharacterized protein n=1 Tax=Rhizophora mucronata TaxID=61149 RepID=A0A2P2Q643_RHIMU
MATFLLSGTLCFREHTIWFCIRFVIFFPA